MPQPIDLNQTLIPNSFPALGIGIFLGLQVLDVVSTLIGLHYGAQEGSAFIGHLLQSGPLTGLIISKILGAGLAAIAIFLNRRRVLIFLNIWFAGIVLWNGVAIFLQATTC